MSARFVKLAGIGGHVPGAPVGNDHFASYLDTSDEWITQRTGIRSRHFAAKGTRTVELAMPAAQAALASAGMAASELEAIIVATATPDSVMPSTACLLQAELGVSGSLAFDVQAACSGFVYAAGVAHGLIASGVATNALVVGAELYSRVLDWQDRSTCVLFGDGCGAAVLRVAAEPGILAVDLHADGSYADVISVSGYVADSALVGDGLFRMEGTKVYKLAVEEMVNSSLTVCAAAGVEPAAIDWFVPHQANLRIINAVAKRLKVPGHAVVRSVVGHANTSAASIPLGMASVWEQVKQGDKILLTAAGAGFTWGSILLQA